MVIWLDILEVFDAAVKAVEAVDYELVYFRTCKKKTIIYY